MNGDESAGKHPIPIDNRHRVSVQTAEERAFCIGVGTKRIEHARAGGSLQSGVGEVDGAMPAGEVQSVDLLGVRDIGPADRISSQATHEIAVRDRVLADRNRIVHHRAGRCRGAWALPSNRRRRAVRSDDVAILQDRRPGIVAKIHARGCASRCTALRRLQCFDQCTVEISDLAGQHDRGQIAALHRGFIALVTQLPGGQRAQHLFA